MFVIYYRVMKILSLVVKVDIKLTQSVIKVRKLDILKNIMIGSWFYCKNKISKKPNQKSLPLEKSFIVYICENVCHCSNSLIGIRKRLHLLVFDNCQCLDN